MKNKYWIYLIIFGLILQLFTMSVHADIGNENIPLLPIDLINNNIDWRLQGKHPVSGEWVNCTEQLSFKKWYQEDDSVKINITFTFPVRTDYRLDIVINKRALQYIEHEGKYNYSINYSDINIYFNFYDMVIHSDELYHGMIEYQGKECLWVRFVKYNCPIGTYTIDPTLGFSGTSTYWTNIKNVIYGMYNLIPSSSGWCDTMYAYTGDLADFGAGRKLWVALYEYNGSNYVLLGEKERIFLAGGFLPSWKKFQFNESVYINENEKYAITISANLNTKLYRDEIFPPIRRWIGESVTYDNYNNPWTTFSYLGFRDWCLYAVYVGNVDVFNNYRPVNGTENVSFDGTYYVTLSLDFYTTSIFPRKLDFYIKNTSFVYFGSVNVTENGTVYINCDLIDNSSIFYQWYCTVNVTDKQSDISYFKMDDIEIILMGVVEIPPDVIVLFIAFSLFGFGIFKEDNIIGFLSCFASAFIFLTAWYYELYDVILNPYIIIVVVIALAIGAYKAFLEIDNR